MTETKKINTDRIDKWSHWLLMGLAAGSFILSYAAMYKLAQDSQLNWLAWLWPLITESAVVIFSLGLLRAKLHGYDNNPLYYLIMICTGLSVIFNIVHSPVTDTPLLTKSVYALPPLFLFLSFKLLLWQVQKDNERHNAIATVGDLQNQAETLRLQLQQKQDEATAKIQMQKMQFAQDLQHQAEVQRSELHQQKQLILQEVQRLQQNRDSLQDDLAKLQAQIDRASIQLAELRTQTNAAKSGNWAEMQQKARSTKQAKIDARRKRVAQLLQEGLNEFQVLEMIEDVNDIRTIRTDIEALQTNGHSNGNGAH